MNTKRKAKQMGEMRPPPSPKELERIADASARGAKRVQPVETIFEAGSGSTDVSCGHSDVVGWSGRLMDTFGTASIPFVQTAIGALDYSGRPRGEARGKDAGAINSGLALVAAVNAENELEAALAIQMAGVHSLACEMLGRARQTDRTDHIALYGGLAVKLTRTFTLQAETLAKLRTGGRQTVEVKHVHVNGNAVVGDVHGAGGGVLAGIGGQPHAQALTHAPGAPCPPLRGDHAGKKALPLACGEGKEAMPNARRR